MKKLFHLSVLFCFGAMLIQQPTIAQKTKYKIAEKYAWQHKYDDAAKVYEDILRKDPNDKNALRAVADCYLMLWRNDKAESALRELIQSDAASSKDLHKCADVLKINKKYDEALNVYKRLAAKDAKDQIAAQYIEDQAVFEKILRDSSRFEIALSEINSAQSDFGVHMLDQQMVFCSARNEGNGSGRKYPWNEQSYLNLFTAILNADSSLSNPQPKDKFFNTRFHEGTLAWDGADNSLILTRNNVYGNDLNPSSTFELNTALMVSEKVGDTWSDPVEVAFNNKEYSFGHPSISEDFQLLFFASDKSGGMGGSDIWYCVKNNGEWSTPINPGASINTAGNEMFPFVLGDKLFFASDGKAGLGGQDIFYSAFESDRFDEATNLGYPVNSSSDDFGIFLFPGAKRGYFSSNRTGGVGDDDIYELIIQAPKMLNISGRIVDNDNGEPIDGAQLYLETLPGLDDGKFVAKANPDGTYMLEIPFADEINLKAMMEMYYDESIQLKPGVLSGYIEDFDIRMNAIDYAIAGIIRTAEADQSTDGARVALMDSTGNVLDEVITKKDGKFFFTIREGANNSLEVSKDDYLTLREDISTKGREKGIIDRDFTLFKPEKGVVVKVNNIYYDYNESFIRSDAAEELDRLVRILSDNPSMKIELGSHSDSRGTDSYNLKLSQQRAKSAVEYIISQGIDKSRIISKGYGETRIKNRCKNGVDCTDEEHEMNRRTEFTILDI